MVEGKLAEMNSKDLSGLDDATRLKVYAAIRTSNDQSTIIRATIKQSNKNKSSLIRERTR